ncbi:MAG: amidohydrolase [Schleiferiaceae bacterium]|nr:amidohydrolase [Schleiferiaceae bacterium]
MEEKDSMKIYGIQSPLAWMSPKENLDYFSEFLAQKAPSSGLIVLPEMFTTGFTMNPETVACHPETVLYWMRAQAKHFSCAITGSAAIQENNQFFNRLFFVSPEGKHVHYDKRHLFSLAGEDKVYQPGDEKVIVVWQGWRILLQVCYDLRFPVFSRNTEAASYDLVIYVANWPKVRSFAWQNLLIARAIENQCYVVGINRTGTDGNGHPYEGASGIIDFKGLHLAGPAYSETSVVVANLDKIALRDFREKFAFLKDQDQASDMQPRVLFI